MWMRDAPEPAVLRPGPSFSQGLALAASMVGVVIFGVLGAPFISAATIAAQAFGR
jgi:hypothetical protein